MTQKEFRSRLADLAEEFDRIAMRAKSAEADEDYERLSDLNSQRYGISTALAILGYDIHTHYRTDGKIYSIILRAD